MHQTLFIDDLAIILCTAAIVTILFQKIKQPAVLGYLVAGIIVGPYTPPFSHLEDEPYIQVLAELGVIFLMFSLGLEFSVRKLTKVGLPALVIGFVEVVLMMLIGFGAGKLLGWSSFESLLLGGAIAISSTTIIIKALEELNLKKQYFAELMVGVLLIEDLLAILLLVFISTNTNSEGALSYQILSAGFKLILVIGSWILLGYFAIPYIMRKIQRYINHETLIITSVGLCLLLSSIGLSFKYSAALGAFIMGSILAVTPQAKRIETLTLPIRDIFAAVFFVSVGMLIDPIMIYIYFPYILLLSAITILGKIAASGIGALLSGESRATALQIGFGMAQIGEFSFIIVGLGISISPISEALFPIIVSISVITTFATPYLIKYSMKLSKSLAPKEQHMHASRYAKWLHRISSKAKHQFSKGSGIIRFIINGIIVAIICTIADAYVIPQLYAFIKMRWALQLIVWALALGASTPFLWAMVYGFKEDKDSKQTNIRLFAWTVVIAELGLLIVPGLQTLWLVIPLGMLVFLSVWFYAPSLKSTYFWMEKHLIKNLSSREDEEEDLIQQLSPWNNEFIRLSVLSQFPFIGRTLAECHFRPAFGVNIIAIKRDLKTIWLPKASERILPNDELIILGDKAKLDQFKEFAQKGEVQEEEESEEQMELKTIAVKDHQNLINRKISDSNVREEFQGIIVGLERQGERLLNPAPSTLLQEGDVLLIIQKL